MSRFDYGWNAFIRKTKKTHLKKKRYYPKGLAWIRKQMVEIVWVDYPYPFFNSLFILIAENEEFCSSLESGIGME